MAERLLVHVHHLGQTDFDTSIDETGQGVTGFLRSVGKDGGMHLHSRWDPDDRNSVADRIEHVPSSSVTAAEHDKVDISLREAHASPTGVIRRALIPRTPDHLMVQAEVVQNTVAHLAGRGQELDLPVRMAQGADRPSSGQRHSAPGQRDVIGVPVRSLEGHASAHPGDGVYDESQEHGTERDHAIIRPWRTSGK
ncbi:MAG: hypothetical protein A4E30_01499 [Methanomassiliicoccales archaeon PtaB.Bin215]|nr:MAG: hypothetical protein A4E30_01499 [Methanomassiliicoccales archaeon PtaB.Bin215]